MSLRSDVRSSLEGGSSRRLKTGLCGGAIVLVATLALLVSTALADTPSFSDVPSNHPYYAAITNLATRQIILGKADLKFHPNDPVTRQQFAKMIVKTMRHDVPANIACPFTDVDLTPNPVDPLYPAKYVAVCALHGITQGKTETTFEPTKNIVRFQVMTMVMRAIDELYPGLLAPPPAGFVPTWNPALSPQHGANAARAQYNGLLAGIDLAALDPLGDMTRGEIAQVLHNVLGKIPAPAPPPGGDQVVLGLADNGSKIELGQDQELIIRLRGNPSSGYLWQPVNLDKSILSHLDTTFINQESDLLGASCDMSLRFAPVSKGTILLEVRYQRPWELKPVQTFSVTVEVSESAKAAGTDGAGTDKHASFSNSLASAADYASGAHMDAAAVTLPSSFDWRVALGNVAARDQGQVGTCWAFATVAPLEFNLKRNNITRDLSEQYLVSCNTDGWTAASGGWFAHDYHFNKPSGSQWIGPVLEAECPYTASDADCTHSHDHMYQLASWSYVGTSSGVPSVAAIKEAIYRYGPVACAVYAGPSFQAYTGGAFSTNETGYYAVNHAVVLVGWTSDGCWILRNSWGTGWGESGYMRIKYGTSNIGYAANYIVSPRTVTAPHYQSFMMNIASPLDSKFGWLLARENDDSIVGTSFYGARMANMDNLTKENLVSISGLGGVRDTGVSGERKLQIYSSGNVVEYSLWYGSTYTQGEAPYNGSVTINVPQGQSFIINIARPGASKNGWIFAREHYGHIVGKAFSEAASSYLGNTTKENLLTVSGLGGVRDTATANQKKLEIYSSGSVVEYSLWYGSTYTQGEVPYGGMTTITIPHYQSFAINIARPGAGKSGWLFARENDNYVVGKTFTGGTLAYTKNDTRDTLLWIAGLGGLCDTGVPGEGGLGLGLFPDLPQSYLQKMEWSLWYGSSYSQGEVH